MILLETIAIVLLMAGRSCQAACEGSQSEQLQFNSKEQDLTSSTGINWFYYGSAGNVSVTIAFFLSNIFTPIPPYDSRLRRNSPSTVDLTLLQPTLSDAGIYGCNISYGPNVTSLDNITFSVSRGATPENFMLNLTYTENDKSLRCSGPSNLGDAELAIVKENTTLVQGDAIPLTVNDVNPSVRDESYICVLTGPGALCSSYFNGTYLLLGIWPFIICFSLLIGFSVAGLVYSIYLLCTSKEGKGKDDKKNEPKIGIPVHFIILGIIAGIIVILFIATVAVYVTRRVSGSWLAGLIISCLIGVIAIVVIIFVLIKGTKGGNANTPPDGGSGRAVKEDQNTPMPTSPRGLSPMP